MYFPKFHLRKLKYCYYFFQRERGDPLSLDLPSPPFIRKQLHTCTLLRVYSLLSFKLILKPILMPAILLQLNILGRHPAPMG